MDATDTPTLDELFHRHVRRVEGKAHGWDDNKLHVSDLGACARATMYRLSGEPRRERTDEEQRKQECLFWLANRIHDEMYEAWSEAGVLLEKECSLQGYLPKGWTGRFDCVLDYNGGRRIVDVKTVIYLQKTAIYPKPAHMMQVACYDAFVHEDWDLTMPPVVFYVQNNFQHDIAVECVVSHDEPMQNIIVKRMAELEHYRDKLPELPPILPRTMKYGKKVRGKSNEVVVGPDSKCNPKYCDWCTGACQPDLEVEKVAARSGDEWAIVNEAYRDDFLEWLQTDEFDSYDGGV